MKNQTPSNILIRSCLVLTLALATGNLSACAGNPSGTSPASMAPGHSQSAMPAEGKTMTDAKMMARCMEMAKQKQQMMADMKAQDAKLTEQLTQMNSAPKNKKVALMAAVITTMVEQRITMDARKAKMEEEMMQHMMGHMQMGKDSMAQCPMMKGMKGMDAK